MQSPRQIVLEIAMASLVFSAAAAGQPAGQRVVRKAPTLADWEAVAKLPDFTGVWEAGGGGGGAARGAAAPAQGAAPAAAAGGRAQAAAATPAGGAQAAGRAGGRGGGGRGGPSLTPEYAAKAKAAPPPVAEENLTANCLPPGLPGILGQPYPL
jgi:hypothetical protein